ncbi:hypothetical protein Y032_0477g2179 [Ancylostoma ceylanicum]|uniref:SH2 domain-containing protein n=1 Tax=Ancylostoma ceylanicum TaxID=53326 RepID=A0A016WVS8_9BILA|nr:hypothetical protein Y032_0477g2179 [Ancylostoma ceylanicum]
MSKVKSSRRQHKKSTILRPGSSERKSKASINSSSIRCRKAQKTLETVEQPPDPVFQQVDKELTRHQWFHGMMPRSDCEEMLKDEGDFLVRKTTVAKATTYCISVRHGGETKHIPIAYDKGIWSLLEVTLSLAIEVPFSQKLPQKQNGSCNHSSVSEMRYGSDVDSEP